MVKLVQPEWGTLTGDSPLTKEEIESKARQMLGQMTLREKVRQMSADTPLFPGGIQMARAYNTRPLPAGENRRLGIPGIRFSDGPRGVVMYHSTCFPVSMARGASCHCPLALASARAFWRSASALASKWGTLYLPCSVGSRRSSSGTALRVSSSAVPEAWR